VSRGRKGEQEQRGGFTSSSLARRKYLVASLKLFLSTISSPSRK
jgi:hypothetical protein